MSATAPSWMSRWASLWPTSGLPWVSAETISSLAPPSAAMPPSALTASAASCAPFCICWPSAALLPVSGCSEPILIVPPAAAGGAPAAPEGADPPQAVSTSAAASAVAAAAIRVRLMSAPRGGPVFRSPWRNGIVRHCAPTRTGESSSSARLLTHWQTVALTSDGGRAPLRSADRNGGAVAETQGTEAAARVVDVLVLFTEGPRSWGVSAIARRLGLSKAVVHRILQTLVERGLLVTDPDTRGYVLGPTAAALGARALRDSSLRAAALPVLRRLQRETGETTTVSARVPGGRVYLDQVESTREIKMTV